MAGQFVLVTNEDIIKSLDLHGKRGSSRNADRSTREALFTEEEVEIRDCFDRFLEGLELFNNYIKTIFTSCFLVQWFGLLNA